MKAIRKLTATLSTLTLTAALALTFNACSEQSPLAASDTEMEVSNSTLAKRGDNGDRDYPQSDSMTLKFQTSQNQYFGGQIRLPNGSSFQVDAGALTPPPGTPVGQDVTITMLLEKIKVTQKINELIYTFGPSGSHFNPPAELWFDWHEVGSKSAKLYLIDENGNRVPQQPEYEDKRGKKFMVHVDHFSRYAIGAE